jgi:hypothetical protein
MYGRVVFFLALFRQTCMPVRHSNCLAWWGRCLYEKDSYCTGEGSSEGKAPKRACENVVMLTESELSICLADVNYSSRACSPELLCLPRARQREIQRKKRSESLFCAAKACSFSVCLVPFIHPLKTERTRESSLDPIWPHHPTTNNINLSSTSITPTTRSRSNTWLARYRMVGHELMESKTTNKNIYVHKII